MAGMVVLFVIDNDFENIYFTTPEKYSQVLKSFDVSPDRVKYKNVSFETLMLILDNQVDYIRPN
ncbi:unnamed protein product [marine sediment metagenome]|uniref:Uncharacterized protein n=1 Tax=marine sediment metagenome TaxID=412755 RepID=X1UM10_9ZZZZ